jgi:hypothetical protein
MNRKIAFVIIIYFLVLVACLAVVSYLITPDPYKQKFSGIVSDYSRLYPSKVKFTFENQNETYYMSTSLEEFKKSLSFGDSVVKQENDSYIYIYKKEREKYKLFKRFIYE